MPGTRYSFTKKNLDLKPYHMLAPLRVGEEYVFQKVSYQYTSDHTVRTFKGSKFNPGLDYTSRLKFCAESCAKMSNEDHDPWTDNPTWSHAMNRNRPVSGFIVQTTTGGDGPGRCYCQESYAEGTGGL